MIRRYARALRRLLHLLQDVLDVLLHLTRKCGLGVDLRHRARTALRGYMSEDEHFGYSKKYVQKRERLLLEYLDKLGNLTHPTEILNIYFIKASHLMINL